MKLNPISRSLIDRVADRISPSRALEGTEKFRPRHLVIEALEPRVLFSGAPVAAPAEAPAPAAQPAPTVQSAPVAAAPAEAAPPEAAPEATVVAAPEANVEIPAAAPEEGDAASANANPGDTVVILTSSEVSAIAQAAVQRWNASGLTAEQQAALANITYQIFDLDGSLIGSSDGTTITIDINAAGRGWFVDSTPLIDEEYSSNGVTLIANGGEAGSRIDLLTALLHEQAHILGLSHSDSSGDLLFDVLNVGERRLPSDDLALGATPGASVGVGYLHTGLIQVTVANQTDWDNAVVAGLDATKEVVFSGAGATINVTGAVTVGALHFSVGTYTLSGGTINLGGPASIQTNVNATISSAVGGSAGLTKLGASTLTISNASNTFSGDVTLNGGNLTFTVVGSLPTGKNFNFTGSATLQLNNAMAGYVGGIITVGSGITASIYPSTGNSHSYAAAVSGSNTSVLSVASGNGGSTITVDDVSAFTGILQVGSGSSSSPTLKIGKLADGVGFGNLRFAGTLNGTATFEVFNNSGPLTLNHRQIEITNGTGVANTLVLRNNQSSASNTLVINTDLINSNTGARTFRLEGSNTGQNIFAGNISDGSGTISFAKAGNGIWALGGTNSYTGITTVSAGTLEVTTLANGGADSSIGKSSNAATNLVLSGGTLRYVGTGGSTDRSFTQSGNVSLDASGTGAINFTNTATPGYGTANAVRALTLTGTNTDYNILAATLTNNGTSANTLIKTGTGTWAVSGANTFTGTTTVSGGGTLMPDYSSQNNSKLSDSAALILSNGAGDITLRGGSHVEQVGSLTISSGGGHTSITRDGGSSTIAFGATNRTQSGGVTLSLAEDNLATTTSATVNGILSGGITVGSNWAKVDAGNIVALTASDYTALPTGATSGTTNYQLIGGTTRTAGMTLNSLRIEGDGNDQVLDLGTSTLRPSLLSDNGSTPGRYLGNSATGGILYAGGGNNNYTITGTGGANIQAQNSNQELIINTYTGTLTVNVPLVMGNTNGALTKSGAGTLVLGAANTYLGKTFINDGMVQFAKQTALYNNATANWTAANIPVSNGATLAFNVGGTDEFTAGNVTTLLTNLAVSANSGMFAGSNLGFDTTNASGGSFTIADIISDTTGTTGGARGLAKLGTGTLVLDQANTYSGATNVNAGTLLVNGNQSTATGAVTVASAATLGGIGTVGGTVTVVSGGTLAAGSGGIGTLNLSTTPILAGTVAAQINKSGATLSADKINVAAALTYGGTLTVTASGDTLAAGDVFDLFDATGFSGSFTTVNLPTAPSGTEWDTSQLLVDGTIRLLSVSTGSLSAGLDGSNNLVITDTDGTGKNNQFTISNDGSGNIVITDAAEEFESTGGIAGASLSNGNRTLTVPLASIAGTRIIFNAALGNDTLTASLANSLGKILDFNGGPGGFDSLILSGGTTTSQTFNFTNENDGSVVLAGAVSGTINYTGLEPITSSITATNVTLNYSAASETITVTNAGGGQTTVDSTAGEIVTFNNPTGTLTINAGDGNDIINVVSLAANYPAVLVIDGQGGTDTVNLNNAVTLAANLTATSETINLGATITSAGDLTLNGAVSLGANATLSAANALINGGVALGANTLTTNVTGLTSTVTGVITGTGGLIKQGAGTLTLTGANNFSGGTTVNASSGSVIATVNTTQNSLGTGAVSIGANSTVLLNNTSTTGTTTISNSFTGTGLLKLNFAAGTTARNTGMAGVSGFAGTIQLSNSGTTGDKWNAVGINAPAATVVIDSGSQLYLNSSASTFAGVSITGTGNSETRGAIRLASGLSAPVTLLGNATIGGEGGTITGNISTGVAGTSTLTLGTSNSNNLAADMIKGVISDGTGTLALNVFNLNGGNIFILGSRLNTYSGGTTLLNSSSGTRLVVGAVTGTPYGTGAITIGQAATDKAGIYFNAANTTLANNIVFNTGLGSDRPGIRSDVTNITLSGQITANLAAATFSTNGTGTLNLTGKVTGAQGLTLDNAFGTSLTVTLSNAAQTNDYSGDTTIAGTKGILVLGGANQIPNGTGKGNLVNNGTFRLAGFSETINGLSGTGTVNGLSGTPTLTVGDNNATSTFTGVLQNTAGTLALTKIGSGTLTLTNTSTHSGATTVTAGTLSLGTAGSIANSATTVQTGATLMGTGTTGALTIDAGAFHKPGNSPGITTVNGNYVQNGALEIEIGTPSGSVPGTDYDQVKVIGNGSVTIGGTATLTVPYLGAAATFNPAIAQVYTIIDNDGTAPGDTTGTFSGLPDGATISVDGKLLKIFYKGGDGNDVVLVNAATPTTVYVEDTLWSSFTNGTVIADADFGTTGNQAAVFGINAFSSIAAAQAAVASGGIIIVNGGTYAEAVTLANTQTLRITGLDAAQAVIVNSLATSAGQTVELQGSSTLTFGDATNTAIDGLVTGSGNLVKQGSGTVTVSGANNYAGATSVNAGTLTITDASALGTTAGGTAVLSGAALTVNLAGSQTLAENLTFFSDNPVVAGTNRASMNIVTSGGQVTTFSGNLVANSQGANLVQWSASGGGIARYTGDITGNLNGTVLFFRGGSPHEVLGSVNLSATSDVAITDNSTVLIGAAAKTYSWRNTNIAYGTLRLGAANVLPATTAVTLGQNTNTASHLDLNGFNQTIGSLNAISNTATANTLTIAGGTTLNVNGDFLIGRTGVTGSTTNLTAVGTGALNVNAPAGTVEIGRANSDQNSTPNNSTVNLASLSSFTANVTNFRVGFGSRIGASLLLSDTANSITATTVTVSDTGNNNGTPAEIILGTGTNVINATTINLGLGKGNGTIKFASQAAASPGTVTIRGKSGGVTTANITVGEDTVVNTGASITGVLDLRGHNADVLAGTVTIGRRTIAGAGGVTGTVSFDQGTFTANTVNLATRSGAFTGDATGTLNIGGGVFTVNTTMSLANKSDGGGAAIGTVNLTGDGVLVTNGNITQTGTATTLINITGNTDTARLEIKNNATVSVPITIGARQGVAATADHIRNVSGNNTISGPINGATGGSEYHITSLVGTLTISGNVDNANAGVRNLNIGGAGNGAISGNITGSWNVSKVGGGIWTMSGNNTYAGFTFVTAGSLIQNGGSITQTTSLIVDAATFQVLNDGNVNILGGVINGAGTSNVFVDSGTLTVGNGFGADVVRIGSAGGNGVVNVNGGAVAIGVGAGNLDIGVNTNTGTVSGILNAAAASSVTIDVANVRIGFGGNANLLTGRGDLILSDTGTNTITANALTVGDTTNTGNPLLSTVQLGGAANNLNIDSVTIADAKSVATLSMDAGGTLTLNGKAGAGNKADLFIGNNDIDTGTGSVGIVNLTGGTFNAELDELRVGRHGQGAGNGKGTLTFDAGTVTANTLVIGEAGTGTLSATPNNTTGTVTMNGGSFDVSGSMTLGLNGAIGNFTANGGTVSVGSGTGSNFFVGRRTEDVAGSSAYVSTFDVSGAASFNANVNQFNIGTVTGAGTGQGRPGGTALLSANNTITATSILIGDSAGVGLAGHVNTLSLGAANIINATTITVGGNKTTSRLDFLATGSTATFGSSGARVNLNVGNQTVGTGGGSNGIVDFNGSTVTGFFNNIVVGSKPNTATGATTGVFSMNMGTVEANSLLLGRRTDAGVAGTVDGIFNLGGGLLDLRGGNIDDAGGTAAFNFTAGTLRDVNIFGIDLNQNNGAGLLQVGPLGAIDLMTVDGNYTGAAGGTLEIGLDGTAGAGVAGGHDQLKVNGTVTLNGLTLAVLPGYLANTGDTFVIIDNDGVDPVTGTFLGLAEGATFFGAGSLTLQITYKGGTGNDVVLTAIGETGVALNGDGDLVITDINGSASDDRLNISVIAIGGSPVPNAIRINDPNQVLTSTVPGSIRPDLNTVIVPFTAFDNLIVDTGGGDDIINLGNLTGFGQSITVDGGAGFDLIQVASKISGNAGESYSLSAERVNFQVGSSVAATGSGSITVNGTGGGTGTGQFGFIYEGVKLKGAHLSTVDGNITVVGQGGADATANEGVELSSGSTIKATGAGSVSITGTGGTLGSSNAGVSLIEGSMVSSGAAGGVTILATGGGERDSHAVDILHGSTVSGGALGVSITGTSTGTGVRNDGVYVVGSTVTAAGGGSVTISGTGSQSAPGGGNAIGVRLSSNSVVGVSGAGGITLNGTGGSGSGSGNEGVHIGLGTSLATASGNIVIRGTGTGTGSANIGVNFLGGSSARSGGALTIAGTGGNGTYGNAGVSLVGTTLSSAGGNALSVTGTGRGSQYNNRGIVGSGATITGGGGGNVTLTGTGSQSSTGASNEGVGLTNTNASTAGTLKITGTGGTGTGANSGIRITGGSLSGTLDLDGFGGGGGAGNTNVGTYLTSVNLGGASAGSDIFGAGGLGSGGSNHGVIMQGILGGYLGAADGTAGAGAGSKAKVGNFFNFLPAFLAVAAAEERSRGKVLAGLMRRILVDSEGIPVYREEDGMVGLDPVVATAETLEGAGIYLPAAPEGTRAVVLLTGDDHEALAGFVAFVAADGELVSSEPMIAPADLTISSLLTFMAGERTQSWSTSERFVRTKSFGELVEWGV